MRQIVSIMMISLFLVCSACTYAATKSHAPQKMPTNVAERLQLANKLVARFDKLTKDEQKMLEKLGDQAFQAALPLAKARLQAYETAEQAKPDKEDNEVKLERFSDVMSLLHCTADKKHTRELIDLLNSAKTQNTRPIILCALGCRGDEKITIPLFLNILNTQKPSDDMSDNWEFDAALNAVAGSSDPQAVDYLIQQLKDPEAPKSVRYTAFLSLAQTGGKKGLEAVLAARDTRRTIPTVSQFMKLDGLAPNVKPKTDEFEWVWSYSVKLLATQVDSQGITRGLIASRVAGRQDDLWIATFEGEHWVNPLFTASTGKEPVKTNWVTKYTRNPSIPVDSDNDGWQDLVEKRFGTNTLKADTDGDGLKDSEDKNPLTAPRKLIEKEKIIAAAFQARFQFEGERDAVCLVKLPKGMEPFELMGWEWVIVTEKAGVKSPLESFIGKGIGTVSFGPPSRDPKGNSIKEGPNVMVWNKDHTEVVLQLCTHFGGTDGTGYDILLKKFGDEWVVVGIHMAWIS